MGYIVRFVRTDKQPNEDYYYQALVDANKHLDLFVDDTSGLYARIALIGDNNVERILVFEGGRIRADFHDQDLVRLRSGYRQRGEEQYLYSVVNIHEDTGRCLIRCLNSGMAIGSAETVGLEMIDRVIGIDDVLEVQQ